HVPTRRIPRQDTAGRELHARYCGPKSGPGGTPKARDRKTRNLLSPERIGNLVKVINDALVDYRINNERHRGHGNRPKPIPGPADSVNTSPERRSNLVLNKVHQRREDVIPNPRPTTRQNILDTVPRGLHNVLPQPREDGRKNVLNRPLDDVEDQRDDGPRNLDGLRDRSEERRVGKECRSRWAAYSRK